MVMANTGVWTELLFLVLLTFLLLPPAQGAPANFWWWDDPAYDLDFVYDFGGNSLVDINLLISCSPFRFIIQRSKIMVIDESLRNFQVGTGLENEKINEKIKDET